MPNKKKKKIHKRSRKKLPTEKSIDNASTRQLSRGEQTLRGRRNFSRNFTRVQANSFESKADIDR